MKTCTQEDLSGILDKHRAWLHDEDGGECANLSGANLSGANLSGTDLSGTDLRSANLSGANLSGTDLSGTDLSGANLSGTDLSGTDLSDANLSDANLRSANLRSANLRGANLYGANLSDANLSELSSIWGASGNCREVKAVQCGLWPVTYTADRMQIGCQLHALDDWWAFTDEEISRMDSRALAWWEIWKPVLNKIIEVSPAVASKAAPDAELLK